MTLHKMAETLEKSSPGFTLIELLIVVAIIGILGTVALPYYQGSMIRARLVEVENAMACVKSALSSYRQERDVWPDCPTLDSLRTSLGISLLAISRMSGISVAVGDGCITATVQGVHPTVDGKTMMLRPVASPSGDGSFSWVWDYGLGFPIQLRQRGT